MVALAACAPLLLGARPKDVGTEVRGWPAAVAQVCGDRECRVVAARFAAGARDDMAPVLTQISAGPDRAGLNDAVSVDLDRKHATPDIVTDRELKALAVRCAPTTPVAVLRAIAEVESSRRPLLIVRNGHGHRVYTPSTTRQAEDQLKVLAAQGADYDVGLMQLNVRTLSRLHLDPADMLDPCRNLAAASDVFDMGYAQTLRHRGATIPLMSAYSLYNTGSFERGYRNGYADLVEHRLARRSTAAETMP